MKIWKWIATSLLLLAAVLGIVGWADGYVAALETRGTLKNRTTIIIDAGHGGVDGGASTGDGVLESGLNLQISLRLEALLHLLGYPTRMIRTEDVSVYTEGHSLAQKKVSDLKNRVRMINETPHALLLSIHQNSFPDGRYRGAQVFYPKTSGSKDLAEALQTAMNHSLEPFGKRRAKTISGVYLMDHIQCAGVLIECGFLSNEEEAKLLKDPAYQKKLCCVIAATVCGYLDQSPSG